MGSRRLPQAGRSRIRLCTSAVALWIALAAGLAPLARAETLQDAWKLAVEHDQGLAAARAESRGADAQARAANGSRWPTLDASGGYTRFDGAPELDVATPGGAFRSNPLFMDNQFFMGSVQMKLPLYAGGQISAGIDAARNAAVGAQQSEQATSADLKLEVARAYVDVLRARRSLRAAESSVASLTSHVADVRSMLERQLVPRSDLLAAEVALANAEQVRVRSANAVQLALAAYNRLLGQPLERSPDLSDQLPVDVTLAAQPIADLVHRALESRGELKALSARAEALAAQSRAEHGKSLPQVALTGGYTHLDNAFLNRENFATVGVGVTWSLFDGGQTRNRAAALRSESRAAAHRRDDVRSMIELQVRRSLLDVHEAEARLRASSAAVGEADENLRMTRELYGIGMGTNTQVLEAVALQVSAVSNRDNAILDQSLTLLELAHAIGAL